MVVFGGVIGGIFFLNHGASASGRELGKSWLHSVCSWRQPLVSTVSAQAAGGGHPPIPPQQKNKPSWKLKSLSPPANKKTYLKSLGCANASRLKAS